MSYLKDEKGNSIWKPSVKQERFLSVPLSIKEALYGGAVMAGKTDVLLMYPIVHGWYKHPDFKGLFLRRTMPELRNEVIPRAKSYFAPFGASFNKTDSCFTFPSGALYFLGHCEHEDDVHDYDSMQPNYAAFDELTSFTEWIYTYITVERVRVPKNLEGILPMIVRSGSNPGNIGHQFVYKRFIKPYPKGGKLLVGRGGIKRVFIPATIDDNPHASDQYKKELDGLTDAERKAKKYGDWTAYEGQVFDEFREKHYPGEPNHAVHIVKPFDIPSWWPKVIAIDWGFSAMTSIGFAAISPNRRVYVYRHLMFQRKKIEEWGPVLKYFIDKENPLDIVICHSANQSRGDPHTVQEQVGNAIESPVRLGEKDRVAGKMLLHEYLRWEVREVPQSEVMQFDPEYALQILRNKGQVEHAKYINLTRTKDTVETNIPKLLFFDDIDVRIICEAIKACVYEKSDKSGKKKEDVAEFHGDDPYDMLRMLLHSVDAFFGIAEVEQERLEKQQQVIDRFNSTQDMTAYYRNMRKLESGEDERVPALARFNNRNGFYSRHR